MIFQAQSLSYWLAFLCATILMLPIIAIAILLGGFFGSKLVERDRTRELIAAERYHGDEVNQSHTLGIPVELQGREDFIERLQKLSGRGWSTISYPQSTYGSNDTASNLRELRVLILIWILCCIECASNLEDSKRQALLKNLYDLGRVHFLELRTP